MTDFARAREAMVDSQLLPNGVTDHRILSVMGKLPRERFVPEGRRGLAYIDDAHPIGEQGSGRYLAPPAPLAKLLQLAEIQHSDVVLDVGCGTGYSTAVIAGLAASVVAVESDKTLAAAAEETLASLDIGNAAVVNAPEQRGVPSEAPFDVIVVEGEVDEVPDALFKQLKEGGRLVALISEGATASAHVFVRSGGEIAGRSAFNAWLPPLASMRKAPSFVF